MTWLTPAVIVGSASATRTPSIVWRGVAPNTSEAIVYSASGNGPRTASIRGLRPAQIATGTAIATASTTAATTWVSVSSSDQVGDDKKAGWVGSA